jgi:hypothetical protein
METKQWKNDWPSFVQNVRQAWDNGLSDIEVTKLFAHQRVVWEGVVANIFNDGDVGLHMPRITFRLRDGRTGYASGLVLAIAQQDVLEWMQVQVGEHIRFETEIDIPIDNPFITSGIAWSGSPTKEGTISRTDGYIAISTRNSRLIEILRLK